MKAFDFGECSPNRGSVFTFAAICREDYPRNCPEEFSQSHSILRCDGIRGYIYIYKREKKRHEKEIRVALSRRQMQLNGP